MRTRPVSVMTVLFCLIFFAGFARGAEGVKIGVVDFQKILEESTAGQAAKKEINTQGAKMEADLKKLGKEIESLESQLEKEALVMSRESLEEKRRDFRIKVGDLKALQKKYLEDFQKLEGRIIQKIQKGVFGLLKDLGEKEGYLLILERRAGGVAYFPQAIDVTQRIMTEYDQKVAKGVIESPTAATSTKK